MFEAKISEKMINGELMYIEKENLFDFVPVLNNDIILLLGYIHIGVDSNTMKLQQIWGLSSKFSWVEKRLGIPNSKKGEVIVNEDIDPGLTKRIANSFEYGVSYDKVSGWICIGDYNVLHEDISVEFAKNTVAVIADGVLKALWLKPKFC